MQSHRPAELEGVATVGELVLLAEEAFTLSPRQREIAVRLADGWTVERIAHDLGRSVNTIRTHTLRMIERVGVDGFGELVRWATEQRLAWG